LKDAANNAEVRVIYDAKEVLSGLHTPFVKDPEVIINNKACIKVIIYILFHFFNVKA
jgi:hypothetical protein